MPIVVAILIALLGAALGQNPRSQSAEVVVPGGKLYGTLEIPAGPGPFPVALIIAGSGPTNRDGNNPLGVAGAVYKQLAQGLAAQGIASLRYDKRGIGQSAAAAKREEDLRLDDYVADAKAWLGFLGRDPRFGKRIIIGHSEGSLIGMVASLGRAEGFVALAGPGRSLDVLVLEQLQPQLSPPLWAEAQKIVAELKAGRTVAQVSNELALIFRPSVQPYLASSFRYDPAVEIAKLRFPILVVQGGTDLQVPASDAQILLNAAPAAQKLLLPEMNHVLKVAPADPAANIATYSNAALPLAPGLVEGIARFIQSIL